MTHSPKPRMKPEMLKFLQHVNKVPGTGGIYIRYTSEGDARYSQGNLNNVDKQFRLLIFGIQALYAMLPPETREQMTYYEYTRKVAAQLAQGMNMGGVVVTPEEMQEQSQAFLESVQEEVRLQALADAAAEDHHNSQQMESHHND